MGYQHTVNQSIQRKIYYEEIYPSISLDGTKVITHHSPNYMFEKMHSSGTGILCPEGKRFWLNMPKNASDSTVYQLVYMNKWKDANCFEDNLQDQLEEVVVTLRDPIDRWMKCCLELCNIQLQRLRYSKIEHELDAWIEGGKYLDPFTHYDGHFFRQVDRLAGIHHHKITYVPMNKDFPSNLESVLGYGELPKRRIASENADKVMIWEKLEPKFTDDVIENAKKFYDLDIQLYNQINSH